MMASSLVALLTILFERIWPHVSEPPGEGDRAPLGDRVAAVLHAAQPSQDAGHRGNVHDSATAPALQRNFLRS